MIRIGRDGYAWRGDLVLSVCYPRVVLEREVPA